MRLGLSRGHWSDLLNGKHPYPSARTRARLLEAFAVPANALFDEEQGDSTPDETAVRRALGARYEFMAERGRGATGVVLSALDRRLGRTVAIKIVQPEAVAGVGTEQLLKELGHAAKLTHPNILPVHDAGVENGHPYIVMPLIAGGSLRDRLQQAVRLPVPEAIGIIDGVCRALSRAHSRQLLHCDVKPENILVEDGHAFLSDFGIARRLQSEADEWSGQSGERQFSAGTPAYVSPEQAAGDAIDQRSDIYSLGCVAYEILSGRVPFEGHNTQEQVARRFRDAPPPLRDTAPDVPQAVADVIARAMHVSPNRRPDTAMAFLTELRFAASERSALWETVGVATSRVITRLRSRLGVEGPTRLRLPLSVMFDEFRQSARSLRRDWRFSLNIVLSLGLGLGVGLPALSIADHVFFRPPPGIADPDRVVRLVKKFDANGRTVFGTSMTGNDLLVQSEARTLIGVAALFAATVTQRDPDAEPLRAGMVSGNFFSLLGARPALGRLLTSRDDIDGATSGNAVLGYRYWQRAFAASPAVLGRTMELDGGRYTVVGVAAEGFNGVGLNETHIYLPLRVAGRFRQGNAPDLFTADGSAWFNLLGRLADGLDVAAANQESNLLYRRPGSYRRDPDRTNQLLWESIIPGRTQQTGVPAYRIALWVSIASALLLALVAANLVNLFVARAASRIRQTAIRVALGARVHQLLRLGLLEAAMVGVAGALLGTALSTPLIKAARSLLFPDQSWDRGVVDFRIFARAMVIALAAGAIAAVAAVWHTRRVEPVVLMGAAGGARSGSGRAARILRSAMIMIQASLFAVLCGGSAAFVISVRRATAVDHGFRPDGLTFVEFDLSAFTPDQRRERLAVVADALMREPGVAAVSLGYMVPWWNNANESISVPGRTDSLPPVWFDNATPSHLETMGMQMVTGRWIDESDRVGSEPTIVVNESLAQSLWTVGTAVGRCLRVRADTLPCRRVVGVVRNANVFSGLGETPPPIVYLPYSQGTGYRRAGAIFVRAREGLKLTDEQLRRVVRRADPSLPRARIAYMPQHLAWLTRPYETGRATFSVFGLLAGLVTLIGLSGVLSYLVAQDKAAHAVRIALGAPVGHVVRPVLIRALSLVALGMAMGLLVLVPFRERFDALLYRTHVLSSLVVIPMLLTGLTLALIAAYLPMRTILRIQPMQVLRDD
jgi:putative ABC transport system permease protein